MLFNIKDLDGFSIHATDGNIGQVADFYFDDAAWVIRYFVVDTGSWLASRKVLVSPIAIGQPDLAENVLPAAITQQQVQDSPAIDTDKPVSRQQEVAYLGYFGYPFYWGGLGYRGAGIYPSQLKPEYEAAYAAKDADFDTHLRSFEAIKHYRIYASDGDLGRVQGLIVEEGSWAIRYMVVSTSNWWLGQQVIVSPLWIKKVSWLDGTVTVNLTRQQIKDAPRFNSAAILNREEEAGLHEHYGHAPYWGPSPETSKAD